ncbi:hypothetical protein BJ684DRAFT_17166, partial [Piptocephalis cylindrospora]
VIDERELEKEVIDERELEKEAMDEGELEGEVMEEEVVVEEEMIVEVVVEEELVEEELVEEELVEEELIVEEEMVMVEEAIMEKEIVDAIVALPEECHDLVEEAHSKLTSSLPSPFKPSLMSFLLPQLLLQFFLIFLFFLFLPLFYPGLATPPHHTKVPLKTIGLYILELMGMVVPQPWESTVEETLTLATSPLILRIPIRRAILERGVRLLGGPLETLLSLAPWVEFVVGPSPIVEGPLNWTIGSIVGPFAPLVTFLIAMVMEMCCY